MTPNPYYAEVRRRGCSYCEFAPPGTSAGTFPTLESGMPCLYMPGQCPHGLDIVITEALPPGEVYYPAEILADCNDGKGNESGVWFESRTERALRDHITERDEHMAVILPLLGGMLSSMQADYLEKALRGQHVVDAARAREVARLTMRTHRKRTLVKLKQFLHAADVAAGAMPFQRAILGASHTVASIYRRTSIKTAKYALAVVASGIPSWLSIGHVFGVRHSTVSSLYRIYHGKLLEAARYKHVSEYMAIKRLRCPGDSPHIDKQVRKALAIGLSAVILAKLRHDDDSTKHLRSYEESNQIAESLRRMEASLDKSTKYRN